jgi:hypothetical protein
MCEGQNPDTEMCNRIKIQTEHAYLFNQW